MSDCLNNIICNNNADSHYQNLCYPCFMFFGKWRGDTGELEQKNCDCENCFKTDEHCLKSKKLNKFMCVNCFKKLYVFKHITKTKK